MDSMKNFDGKRERVTIEAADIGQMDSKVFESTGAATTKRRRGPNLVEAAMRQAIMDSEKASEAIWGRHDLSHEAKLAKLAKFNHPDALRERMLAARAAVRGKK